MNSRALRLSIVLGLSVVPGTLRADPGSSSLYQLDIDLEVQDGSKLKLSSFEGSPLIISMFYASCDSACPLIINNIKALERKLTVAERKNVRVLLVSFDPDRDGPVVLKKVAGQHHVDGARWFLARTSADNVENLAAVLGVKYKQLDQTTISHTSVITVVSPTGEILRQSEQFSADAEDLAKALR